MNNEKANALLKQTKEHIARNGRSVFSITGDGKTPNFGYTVGNNKLEFIVFGNIPPQTLHYLLNAVWDAFNNPTADAPTDLNVDLNWVFENLPVKLLDVSTVAASKYNLFSENVYGKFPARVIQVLLTDKNGKYPGAGGYDENFPQVELPTLQ